MIKKHIMGLIMEQSYKKIEELTYLGHLEKQKQVLLDYFGKINTIYKLKNVLMTIKR